MSDRKDDQQVEGRVDDLDVSEAESEDVKGGALNAYISNPTGEKQGNTKWGDIELKRGI